MAVFRRPVNAVRAVANAQQVSGGSILGDSTLYLKAGSTADRASPLH